uniref:Uncharacterized protein n=1 Tax=Alexandrium monilatum TaxID=311494 RepID=A0A6T0T227_9DINO
MDSAADMPRLSARLLAERPRDRHLSRQRASAGRGLVCVALLLCGLCLHGGRSFATPGSPRPDAPRRHVLQLAGTALGMEGWRALSFAPAQAADLPPLPRDFADDTYTLASRIKDLLFQKLNTKASAGRKSGVAARMAAQNEDKVAQQRTSYEEKYLSATSGVDPKLAEHPAYAAVKKALDKVKATSFDVGESAQFYDVIKDFTDLIRLVDLSPKLAA